MRSVSYPPRGTPLRLRYAKPRRAALPLKGGGEEADGSSNRHYVHHKRQAEWMAAMPPVRLRYCTRSKPAASIMPAKAF